MRFVIYVNGLVALFYASLMVVLALIFWETATFFLSAAVLSSIVGSSLCLAAGKPTQELRRPETFLLTASVWMTAALAGTLPLTFWSMTETDAFFEAMSGITTTGSTVMTGLDDTPAGILVWRALLQWTGGVGFIVTGMALLPVLRSGGMQLFQTESSERVETDLGNSARIAVATLKIYVSLTALCAALFLFGGMSPLDAVTHSMATLSTGGFSTHDASFGWFQSAFLEWTAVVFMLAGAIPFTWYVGLRLRHRHRTEQFRALMATVSATVVVLAVARMIAGANPEEAVRQAAFNVVSVITTTGFATTDYNQWGSFAVVVIFLLTFVGGCTGSTAGGAKIMRWVILMRCTVAQVRQVYVPHGIFSVRYQDRPVDSDVVGGVISFFILYFLTFAALAFALVLVGLDLETAASGAITAIANVGPGLGATIGPAGNFASLSDSAKLLLGLGMYLGRLELFTVFVLLLPVFWKEVS